MSRRANLRTISEAYNLARSVDPTLLDTPGVDEILDDMAKHAAELIEVLE